jgi:hypothetical protein
MSLTFRVLSDKKATMNARLITPEAALLSVLSIAAQPGQLAGNLKVFEGPTPSWYNVLVAANRPAEAKRSVFRSSR